MDKKRRKRRSRDELATGARVLLGWGLIVAAAVLLAVGWYGVSGTPVVARQLAYVVSGGLGGLLAGIVGVGLLVSIDVRRDRERLGRVEAGMLELREMLLAQAESTGGKETASQNGADRKTTAPRTRSARRG